MKIQDYILNLNKFLQFCDYYYFVKGQPIIEDSDYDILKNKLFELEINYPQFKLKQSISDTVGCIDFNKQKYEQSQHEYPMLSLKKTYDKKDIFRFFDNYGTLICEPKIDGVSLSLHYLNGILIKGVTRGNGLMGEDVTRHILTIKSIPKKLIENLNIEIRGELFFFNNKNNIEITSPRHEITSPRHEITSPRHEITSPRNIITGILRKKIPDIKMNLVDFLAYEINSIEKNLFTQEEVLSFLKECSFLIPKYIICNNINEIEKHIDNFNPNNFSYQVDGLVFKINNIHEAKALGSTATYNRNAIAFKLSSNKLSSRLLDVKWSLGMGGKITPIAIIDPIDLDGSIISQVTLHNLNFLNNLKIGDTLIIERAGRVIPKIVSIINTGITKILIPSNCISCKALLIKESMFLICNNFTQCEYQRILRLHEFLKIINIKGLGLKFIEKLFKNKIINEYKDLLIVNQDWRNYVPSTIIDRYIIQINNLILDKNILQGCYFFNLGYKSLTNIINHLWGEEQNKIFSNKENNSLKKTMEYFSLEINNLIIYLKNK